MASYLRDLEREGSLPPLVRSEARRVNFDEVGYTRSRSPRARSPRARSPVSGMYVGRDSPQFNPRPPSPGFTRRTPLSDTHLQEQIKVARDELQKKDALIQQLVSMESSAASKLTSTSRSAQYFSNYGHGSSSNERDTVIVRGRQLTIDEDGDQEVKISGLGLGTFRDAVGSMQEVNFYSASSSRQSLDASRTECAELQVKVDRLQTKNKELENELEVRDIKIKESKLLLETSRESEARLQRQVDSLRGEISDLQGRAGAFESVAGRSEVAVSALQRENKSSQERIVDLETRQRRQLEEREEACARVEILERRMKDLLSQFASLLKVDTLSPAGPSSEDVLRRISETIEENALLRGKLLTLNETLNNSELETKASRETIMRLVSEMGREQQMQSRYESERETLRSRSRERYRPEDGPLRSILKSPTRYRERSSSPRRRDRSLSRERDMERSSRVEFERELQMLRDRLEASQRTIDAQRKEIDIRESRLASLEAEIRTSSTSVHSASTRMNLFVDQLSKLLGETDSSYLLEEDSIRCRIEEIILSRREYKYKLEAQEDRIKELTEQLEAQYELHKTAAARARKAEVEAADMRERCRSAEGELAAGDVLRDGFRTDKERYMRCMQRLGEAMKMDRISLDLGLDMTIDALIARAEQLVKMEKDAITDKSTHIYNLQRKVKGLKEQLESKDLHIDLLRKKINSLEEKLLGKSTIERERDSETLRIRKMEKLAEKYKIKLIDAEREIVNLKAQLLGSSELRVHTLEQRKEAEELAKTVEELEKLRRKQAHKIRELKTEINSSNHSSQENRVVADNAVQALTSELRTTKAALTAIQNREKALLDFRLVVARMLGLDINTLAIPDYEIISRLEKLIQAHHSHTFTTLSLEEALADMEDGFVSGYVDFKNTTGSSESHNIRKSRERVKRKALKCRARSMSPQRRYDPKVY
ncbi:coiled-coil domain-containing protein 170-like isoform X1 [Mya arenaria]|uniref:coiled-coil domain-containing protein 170-like isoform X1 n=1 Tax=Mya arenaria TaxID=6604 RepID=UPI0022DEDDC4|nr:coiled-coil domain-containing protein 170-like isoform X1 [Mya arenaria]